MKAMSLVCAVFASALLLAPAATPGDAAANEVQTPAGQAPLVPSWGFGALGGWIGTAGVVVANSPSGPELYANGWGYGNVWYVLRYRPDKGRFEQTFTSESFLNSIIGLGVADVAGDARKEVVIALSSGQVVIYDQLSREKLTGFTAPYSGVDAMELRDGEDDAKAEILLTWSTALHVYSAAGTLLWEISGVGGNDIVTGQMDGDPGLEIALSGGFPDTPGAVVDWTTRTVQWTHSQEFGARLDAADVDGDGRQDLIASEFWGQRVWSYDVATKLPKWSITPPWEAAAVLVANVDCDGIPDLLIGSRSTEKLWAYDTNTRALKWTITLSDPGVGGIAFADVTGDGRPEIVLGEGGSSSGPDFLTVLDPATQEIVWRSVHLDGPIIGPALGDLDGDGEPEVVVASSSSNNRYAGGRIVAFDGRTLRQTAMSPPVRNIPGSTVRDLKLRNVDGDPALEVLIAVEQYPGSQLEIHELAGGQFTRTWSSPASGPAFHAVEAADIDGDGNLEVIGATAWNQNLVVYDYTTGALEWESLPLGPGSHAARVSVLTAGAGAPHIVVLLEGGSIHAFDGVTKQPLPPILGSFTALMADEAGGVRAFLAGDENGDVHRYVRQGNAYVLAASYDVGAVQVDGATRLAGGQLAVGAGGVLSVYSAPGGPLLWTSDDYGAGFGAWVTLGTGPQRRVLAGGGLGVVALAPPLSLSNVAPHSGPAGGGTRLTVSGSGFLPGAGLFVGGKPASAVQVSGGEIEGDTPALDAGALHEVTVVNPDVSVGVRSAAFMTDFHDVAAGHPFHAFVVRLVRNLVSGGCGGGNYCDVAPVTRAQMAVFLLRSRYGSSYVPPPASGLRFDDVPCSAFAAAYIEELARLGISGGCGGGNYCPASSVTRAQMAVFLLTALEGSGYLPPPATGIFTDVPAGDPFARWIEELARRGITGGCGGGDYCPADPVSRGQMAVFLSTTFALP